MEDAGGDAEGSSNASVSPHIAAAQARVVTLEKQLQLVRQPGEAKAPPQWVSPARSGTVSWDDLQGHLYIEWAGEAPSYVIEYTAGSGELSVEGQLTVNGTRKDFGVFSRNYWETWIVPYREVTLRVRDEAGERWSEPLTIKLLNQQRSLKTYRSL